MGYRRSRLLGIKIIDPDIENRISLAHRGFNSRKKVEVQAEITQLIESESNAQAAIVQYARVKADFDKRYKLLAASQNQMKDVRFAGKFKKEGLYKGWPDLTFAYSNNYYHGAFFEVKANKGKATDDQLLVLADLCESGYFACIVYGSIIGIDTINEYVLNGYKDIKNKLLTRNIPVFEYDKFYFINMS